MNTIILILLSLFIPKNNSEFEEFLNQHYKGGSETFLHLIYKSIRYPTEARLNCKVGKLKTIVEISEDGNVSNIDFLNKLGYGIEESVENALQLTSGKWKVDDEKRLFNISFGFRIGTDLDDITGDVIVSAISVPASSCGTSKELKEKMMKFLEKKKYKRAKKYCAQLLERQPDSQFLDSIQNVINLSLKK